MSTDVRGKCFIINIYTVAWCASQTDKNDKNVISRGNFILLQLFSNMTYLWFPYSSTYTHSRIRMASQQSVWPGDIQGWWLTGFSWSSLEMEYREEMWVYILYNICIGIYMRVCVCVCVCVSVYVIRRCWPDRRTDGILLLLMVICLLSKDF